MKIIDFETIRNLNISPLECYEWSSYVIEHKDEMMLPAKISLKPKEYEGVFYNTMPSIIPSEKRAGVKLVTRYPNRVPSLDSEMLLYDLESGDFLAFLDATYVTAMRTGAVAAHSIKLLAKTDFKTIGVLGLGNTCRATFEILAAICPDSKFVLKLYAYKDQHIDFMNRFKDYPQYEFEVCDSYESVIKGSDVIVSAVTVFNDNACDISCFDPGCLVVPVHTMGFQNCDLVFDKVFADDVNHVKGFKYFDKFKNFAEVHDVVTGKVPGRENDEERIIAYNIGISLQDIYYASKIYDKVCDVEDISLNSPTEKFWV